MSTFSTRPPFLRYTGLPLWTPPSPVLSFPRYGNVETFGGVSYGSEICLYVYQVIALKKWLAEVQSYIIVCFHAHCMFLLLLCYCVFLSSQGCPGSFVILSGN